MTLLRRMLDVTFIFAEDFWSGVRDGFVGRGTSRSMYEDLARCKNDPAHTASGREWSRLRMGGVLMYKIILRALIWE